MQDALKVVVVDDRQQVGEVLAKLLETEGLTVQRFSNGKDTLQYLSQNHVDLLYTDLGMPEMSGAQLIEQVLAKGYLTRDRVVGVTGLSFESPDVHWLTNRKIMVLFKPFDGAAIRWSLSTLLAPV